MTSRLRKNSFLLNFLVFFEAFMKLDEAIQNGEGDMLYSVYQFSSRTAFTDIYPEITYQK